MSSIKFIERTFNKIGNQSEVSFFDVLIDGNSLYDQFNLDQSRKVCRFGYYRNKQLNMDTINEFLKIKPSELETGRTMLFICRECGDIGCGAITLEIEKTKTAFIWKKFAYENNSFALDESSYIDHLPIEINRAEYETEFEKLKKNWF